jgi:hypothetical protein
MIVPTSHMMVPTITLLGILNFIYYLNLIYIKNHIIPTSHWIGPISHMMVPTSHLMVTIKWVPYP